MYIELKTWNTRRVILRGEFASHKKAIEHAINQGISLDYLMIEDCDLSNGNFDGGSFSYARLKTVTLMARIYQRAVLLNLNSLNVALIIQR